ncbi:hypothetical protein ATO10_14864 [Actibacterium atlanticum]|uniref:Hemolysin-type calcium-binding protein n=1 Tax=Actibacterium atlanticum TaxID=1461693 RepID=A0A058ZIB7_9RHOB|nr:calcium-binding protein [Actibacterium atlanticum]KCV80942.1 hypothetical protein ATO10_14864 [Actibacterium atlanticum]
MSNTYEDFREALKQRESSGNYSVVSAAGYLGAYQFGEAALIDLGFVNHDGNAYDNNYSGGWTGKWGIDSTAEFLASPTVQDAAADAWFELLWGYVTAFGLDDYLGQTMDGVYITASAIIAGAHLVGIGAMQDWLESGGTLNLTDGNGTPVEEYLALFTGYPMPFDTGESPEDLLPSDVLQGDDGSNTLIGGAEDDTINGAGGNDQLIGGAGDDTVNGGAGRDLLLGGAGGDTLTGETGNDIIIGGDGRDLITGGAGTDILQGQGGTDLFIFEDDWGTDVILDFDASSTGDVVVLSDVSAITDYNDLTANHMFELGDHVVISDGAGNLIWLLGYELSELESGDFVF